MTTDQQQNETMQAAVYRRYGSPEVLEIERLPIPDIDGNEVLIRVHASTVNRTDCGFLTGKPVIVRLFSGLLRPNAPILGCEFAGEIVKTGSDVDVSEFAIGDRVFGFKDDDYGFGGHAQYTAMPTEGMIARIPTSFSYEQAASALEGAHYALHSIRSTGVRAGQSVLVNGATGAIGSAAVQIIKHQGARVTAVCGTEHIELVNTLGADVVIDYKRDDFTQLEAKFDVVMDAVGKSTFGRCRRLLNEHGIYSSTELGPWCQNPILAIRSKLFGKKKVVFPLTKNLKTDAKYLCDLMERGAYRPVLDRTYDLTEIVDAFRYVQTGMKTGNVVIKIT